jgi:hypothetical protein
MIENMVWSITGARRGLGVDIAQDEPSHIHLPRRRRVVRPDDQGSGATWGDEEHRGQAQPASEEA